MKKFCSGCFTYSASLLSIALPSLTIAFFFGHFGASIEALDAQKQLLYGVIYFPHQQSLWETKEVPVQKCEKEYSSCNVIDIHCWRNKQPVEVQDPKELSLLDYTVVVIQLFSLGRLLLSCAMCGVVCSCQGVPSCY